MSSRAALQIHAFRVRIFEADADVFAQVASSRASLPEVLAIFFGVVIKNAPVFSFEKKKQERFVFSDGLNIKKGRLKDRIRENSPRRYYPDRV